MSLALFQNARRPGRLGVATAIDLTFRPTAFLFYFRADDKCADYALALATMVYHC